MLACKQSWVPKHHKTGLPPSIPDSCLAASLVASPVSHFVSPSAWFLLWPFSCVSCTGYWYHLWDSSLMGKYSKAPNTWSSSLVLPRNSLVLCFLFLILLTAWAHSTVPLAEILDWLQWSSWASHRPPVLAAVLASVKFIYNKPLTVVFSNFSGSPLLRQVLSSCVSLAVCFT